MPRTKLSHLAKRNNISKRSSTAETDNSKNQPLADIATRIQNTNVLNTNTTEDSDEFRIWYEGHRDVCSATHVGSSAAMEVNAAVKLWERSETIDFRYTTLLSDGDCKSFLELKKRNVFGSETQIKKEECINHVSKRLGTTLRQTVKDWRVKSVTLRGKKHGSLKKEN
ncbi:uncharacterized protein TNCV_4869821 [Trichonephila clavipes]|nr:uncharacterized protein TNCV_4869821 [Trichonephila clavipes]